jgi:hypothetical protein
MKNITLRKGTTRKVVLIHSLNIVLKFPAFDIKLGIKLVLKVLHLILSVYIFKDDSKKWELRHQCKYWLFRHYEIPNTLSYYLFRGLFANINEARFWLFHRKNPLMIPTYFSLFGLVNIQPIVKPIKNCSVGIWHKLYKLTDIPKEMSGHDAHAWEDKNFTQKGDGSIALYDYGSSRAFPMIKKYGYRFSKVLINH